MKQFRKIVLIILVIAALTLTLTACGSSDTSDGDVYKDGTYTGEGEKREFGYEAAEITIEDGKIADIVLKRMTPDGEEVDYNEWTGEEGADGKTRPNLKQFREDLAEEMVTNQTYDVDVIATATETSEGWKEAVKDALDKAK